MLSLRPAWEQTDANRGLPVAVCVILACYTFQQQCVCEMLYGKSRFHGQDATHVFN